MHRSVIVCYYPSGEIAFVTESYDVLEMFLQQHPGGDSKEVEFV